MMIIIIIVINADDDDDDDEDDDDDDDDDDHTVLLVRIPGMTLVNKLSIGLQATATLKTVEISSNFLFKAIHEIPFGIPVPKENTPVTNGPGATFVSRQVTICSGVEKRHPTSEWEIGQVWIYTMNFPTELVAFQLAPYKTWKKESQKIVTEIYT